ncbi:hypothetical protein PAPYR_12772 [Paratrimastix pyriformis]|uniref:Uncharacterized protein n=1 Tax=Paratrimastix pyriformis TaxID=342808 RepID=A0ABQ8U1B5_9EUKA|nr:hypothetical protein PAPYR_12772 [Paratrimastix pyriformis]
MVFTLSWFGFVWGYPTRLSLVLRTREGEWWDSRVIFPKQTQTKTSLPPTSLPDEWHWEGCLVGEASVAVVQPCLVPLDNSVWGLVGASLALETPPFIHPHSPSTRRLHGKVASTASPAPVGDW